MGLDYALQEKKKFHLVKLFRYCFIYFATLLSILPVVLLFCIKNLLVVFYCKIEVYTNFFLS